jgi:hypothetical protein
MYKKRENKRGGERERERERERDCHSPISNTTIPPKGIKCPPFTPTRREKKKTKPSKIVFRRTPTKQQKTHMDNHLWTLKSSIISDNPTPPPSQPLLFFLFNPTEASRL